MKVQYVPITRTDKAFSEDDSEEDPQENGDNFTDDCSKQIQVGSNGIPVRILSCS